MLIFFFTFNQGLLDSLSIYYFGRLICLLLFFHRWLIFSSCCQSSFIHVPFISLLFFNISIFSHKSTLNSAPPQMAFISPSLFLSIFHYKRTITLVSLFALLLWICRTRLKLQIWSHFLSSFKSNFVCLLKASRQPNHLSVLSPPENALYKWISTFYRPSSPWRVLSTLKNSSRRTLFILN